jgi:hypothetical protein
MVLHGFILVFVGGKSVTTNLNNGLPKVNAGLVMGHSQLGTSTNIAGKWS